MFKISNIIADALAQADQIAESEQAEQTEKVASKVFTSTLAAQMHKVAAQLREADPSKVTYADVRAFASRIAE